MSPPTRSLRSDRAPGTSRRRAQRVVVAALFVLPFTAVFAALPARNRTALVSVNAAGTGGGNFQSGHPSISANGRYVAFWSSAFDLVAADTNTTPDILVRDVRSGTTTLVSVNAAGTGGGNAESLYPSISADGRFVAFRSLASDLVAGDTNGAEDIFVRDLTTGGTTLVSRSATGTGAGDAASWDASISANGRVVAFLSFASDLVAGDTNGVRDVFVRDLDTGATTLVSWNLAGTGGGNAASIDPSISANGQFIAFFSLASDLVADLPRGNGDVFVRDVKAGTTQRVSVNAAGTGGGNSSSWLPSISGNGRFVAFYSDASDLVADDTNGTLDFFVRDMKKGRTTLVGPAHGTTG